ncbi:unnamed protein product [Gongylonema pulchrum]|uniref:Uncharacterized protein n=1 Tax=Gongylonema pulchrum TaxID=637853 RepID=A0A183ECM0_9BILA|nr:unnamed protein product [Gongylonema pulchrum]
MVPDTAVPPPTAAAAAAPAGSGTCDFAAAPPDFSKPPPTLDITGASNKSSTPVPAVPPHLAMQSSTSDGPPGVDEPAPPGSSTPPTGFADMAARHIPTLDTSVPPPAYLFFPNSFTKIKVFFIEL